MAGNHRISRVDPCNRVADVAIKPVEALRAARNKTIRVIDDEPTMQMLVADVLEELGYMALKAADGNVGLKVLRSDMPLELLITDVGLSGDMNVRQLTDETRMLPSDLPGLLITGYAKNTTTEKDYLELGMQMLTKPSLTRQPTSSPSLSKIATSQLLESK